METMNFYDKKHLARLLGVGQSKLEIFYSHERVENLIERSGRCRGVFEDNIVQFLELIKVKFPQYECSVQNALKTIEQRKKAQKVILK